MRTYIKHSRFQKKICLREPSIVRFAKSMLWIKIKQGADLVLSHLMRGAWIEIDQRTERIFAEETR